MSVCVLRRNGGQVLRASRVLSAYRDQSSASGVKLYPDRLFTYCLLTLYSAAFWLIWQYRQWLWRFVISAISQRTTTLNQKVKRKVSSWRVKGSLKP